MAATVAAAATVNGCCQYKLDTRASFSKIYSLEINQNKVS